MWRRSIALAVGLAVAASSSAIGQKKYDIGASDAEIKIGQTMAYSGPLSSYSTIGRLQSAYFKMLNGKGGDRRPQNQFYLGRRRLQSAQDCGTDQEIGGRRGGAFDFQYDGHSDELGHPEVHEHQ
jgi:hypothetical protein